MGWHDDSNKIRHDGYLDELVSHLDKIGEEREDVKWIMKDPVWQKEGSFENKPLCDLLVCFYSDYAISIELKSNHKFDKAEKQILAGRDLLEKEFGLFVPYGKMIVYGDGDPERYHCHNYDFIQGLGWIIKHDYSLKI